MPPQLPDNVKDWSRFPQESWVILREANTCPFRENAGKRLDLRHLELWLNYKLFCLNRIQPEICFNIRAIQPEQGEKLWGFAVSEAIPEGIDLPNQLNYYPLSRFQRTIKFNNIKTYKYVWIFPHQPTGIKPTFTISR